MSKDFESILGKARKLSALASDTAATDGERDNALRMLQAHCDRYNITPERLSVAARRLRHLACILPGRHNLPVLSKDLATLAAQCLHYVAGEVRRVTIHRDEEWRTVRKKRGLPEEKGFRIYVVKSEVTDLEYEEWRDCFHHYAVDFWESSQHLKREAKVAAQAAKMALSGFVHQHGIFPPKREEEDNQKPMTPENLAALMAAMRGAKGDRFVRGKAKIEEKDFFLV